MCGFALADTVKFDDLKAGAPPPGWTASKTGKGDAKWEVVADESAPSKPNVLKQSGEATYPVCFKDDASLKDGFVEVKFKPVSADGTRLCVPTTDARALDDAKQLKGKPDYDIDGRVQKENLASYLRVYDTATGKDVLCERVPKAWVTHVQFSPLDHSLILYNHEWCSDPGIRRMWLWDGRRHLRLRPEGDGRSRLDWTCHEMWERDGSAIIYHGKFANGQSYIGRVKPDGSGLVEIALPKTWNRYGHFTVGRPGWLVTDGCYVTPGEPEKSGGAWISVLKVDWAARTYAWQPLCQHGSSWRSQDAHPHPIFNHASDAILFTSDKTGQRAIYRVPVPAKLHERPEN
jgi:hypothetical protein